MFTRVVYGLVRQERAEPEVAARAPERSLAGGDPTPLTIRRTSPRPADLTRAAAA